MSSRHRQYTEEELILIGRREGSDDVNREGWALHRRWQEDLPVLTEMGEGTRALGAHEQIMKQHDLLLGARPGAVASKKTAIGSREAAAEAGWAWVERNVAALAGPAADDQALANALNQAEPRDNAGLAAGLLALAQVLATYQDRVDPEFNAAQALAEAPNLAARIRETFGNAEQAKRAPLEDTREIDLLDGRILVTVARVNRAAVKAFRRRGDDVKRRSYRHHFIRQRRPGKSGGGEGGAGGAGTP